MCVCVCTQPRARVYYLEDSRPLAEKGFDSWAICDGETKGARPLFAETECDPCYGVMSFEIDWENYTAFVLAVSGVVMDD